MVRLPWMKEFDVKIPMIMLVAGAAIALTAPLANAASTNKQKTAPAHKLVKHGKTGTHVKTGGKLGTTGTSKPVTPRPPLYIYVPGYSGPAVAPDPVDQCESSGVDCTDAQLCEFWGENCSTGIAPSTDQTGAGDQTGSGDQTGAASTDQSVATQPAATVSTSEAQSDSSDSTAASSGDAQSASDMATDDSSDDC